MDISIIIAVLNSHKIVRRQIEHFKKMPLPSNIELLLVDDGSSPALDIKDYDLDNLKIIRHEIDGVWTQPAARNFGVKHACGRMVLTTDIDHIITKDLLDFILKTPYDVVRFKREVAVLDEFGNFIQTKDEVLKYGYLETSYNKRKFRISPHSNSCAINRELFLKIGGVCEDKVGSNTYPNREEGRLKARLRKLFNTQQATLSPDSPTIYMIPNGRFCGDEDYNPFGLFHNLSRKEGRKNGI